jgi:hypothetical protein
MITATREVPERSPLCLKRNVDEQTARALGKEFMAILQDRPLPRLTGREGAAFCICWGEVSADSDGLGPTISASESLLRQPSGCENRFRDRDFAVPFA